MRVSSKACAPAPVLVLVLGVAQVLASRARHALPAADDGTCPEPRSVTSCACGVVHSFVCDSNPSCTFTPLWYSVLPRLASSVAAVAQLTVPVIALAIALSFGTYGLVRKLSPLDSPSGLTLMGSDTPAPMEYTPGNNFSVSLSGENDAELRGYWEKLADGGAV